MEILAVGGRPPGEPIPNDATIRICPKCGAVLKYTYEDMFTKTKLGNEMNFIKCVSCGQEMTVSEVKR